MLQLDKLELMTEDARKQNITELRRMLWRTQISKAKQNIHNWSYQLTLDECIGDYESQMSIDIGEHMTPGDNGDDSYTPMSETRLISEPMSVRASVEQALDKITRKIIDDDMNAEKRNIRAAADRAHSSQQETFPMFQTIQSGGRSRRDQFENDTRDHNSYQHLQNTPRYVYA